MTKRLLNFIGGEFVAPVSHRWLESPEPATGLPAFEVPDSDAADVERAVEAARAAFPAWARKTPAERAQILFRVADLIDANAEELARLESQDQGKPVALARRMDVPRAAQNFRFFGQAILQGVEQASSLDEASFNYMRREPYGVAGLISPWNLPLYLLTWKIAPAIAVGNAAVCKPSELTSATAHRLAELLVEAKLPAGVVNLVFGRGPTAGAALVAHVDVPLISFTGGTVTGRAIAREAAPQFKRLSLELGGKNANLIFDDCDLERALETSIRSSFLNQGEICLCGSRIFVQSGVYDRFLSAFVERAAALRVADPKDESTFMGALVSREHLEKVESYVRIAREDGGRVLCGGGRPALDGRVAQGFFFQPTVIAELPATSRLWREEIFGPVVTVARVSTEDEAYSRANDVDYGLSATVWTESLARAHRAARELRAGTVWINSWMERDLRVPFGGMKASGVGREGGEWSLDFYAETKNVSVRFER